MTNSLRKNLQLLGAGLLFAMVSIAGAQSQGSYPSKPVRVIIPFAPQSSNDEVVRIYAKELGKELGQPFIADNRAGGNGMVGTVIAALAQPDGYTLLGTNRSFFINHWEYPDRTYDTFKDFVTVSPLTRSDFVMVVSTSPQLTSLKEFVTYAKANPGKLNAGSTSANSLLNYAMVMQATGTKFTIVNYKSSGPLLVDLLGSRIHIYMATVGTLRNNILTGKVIGLGVTGGKRHPMLPDVPTFAEFGLKDYDDTNWLALFARSQTPRAVIEKLNAHVRKLQESPDVLGALKPRAMDPYVTDVAQSAQWMRTEAERMGQTIKESGLKFEGS